MLGNADGCFESRGIYEIILSDKTDEVLTSGQRIDWDYRAHL